MKKVFSLVLSLILVLGMFAVATAEEQPTYHFEIVSKGFQSTYWQAVYQGTSARVEELNAEAGYEMITFNFVGPDSESDIAQQVQQFTSALNAAPDAIGFAAVDQSAFMELLERAVEEGIPIIGFDSGVPARRRRRLRQRFHRQLCRRRHGRGWYVGEDQGSRGRR